MRFQSRRDIRILTRSAVCIPQWSQNQRCASSRRVRLCGVHHTPESSSTVCIPPWSQTPYSGVHHTVESSDKKNFKKNPRCASHHEVRLRSVHHPSESDSAVCIPPWIQVKRPRDKMSQWTIGPKMTNEVHYLKWCGQLPNPNDQDKGMT